MHGDDDRAYAGGLPPSVKDLLGPTGRLRPVRQGRKRQVLIRFTDAELTEVERRAAAFGQRWDVPVDPAAFCYLAARLGLDTGTDDGRAGRDPAWLSAHDALDLAAELTQLRRMMRGGVTNLNQLARAANSGQAPAVDGLAAAVRRAEQVVARLDAWLDLLDPRRLVHRASPRR